MAEKLIRDLIPAAMIARRETRRPVRTAEPAEMEELLLAKVMEEAREIQTAPDAASLILEIADLIEVLYALAEQYDYMPEDVGAVRQAKAATHGRFKFGFVMTVD